MRKKRYLSFIVLAVITGILTVASPKIALMLIGILLLLVLPLDILAWITAFTSSWSAIALWNVGTVGIQISYATGFMLLGKLILQKRLQGRTYLTAGVPAGLLLILSVVAIYIDRGSFKLTLFGWAHLVIMFGIFVALTSYLARDPEKLSWLAKGFLSGVTVQCLAAGYQEMAFYLGLPFSHTLLNNKSFNVAGFALYNGNPRANGFSPEASMLGEVILSALPLAVLLPSNLLGAQKYWRWVMAGIFILTGFLTLTRGTLFIMIPEIVFLALMVKKFRAYAIGITLTMATLFTGLSTLLIHRITHFSIGADLSTKIRFSEYLIGWHMFLGHFLFGVGINQFIPQSLHYVKYAFVYRPYYNADNLLIGQLAETGLIGTVIMGWWIYSEGFLRKIDLNNPFILGTIFVFLDMIGSTYTWAFTYVIFMLAMSRTYVRYSVPVA